MRPWTPLVALGALLGGCAEAPEDFLVGNWSRLGSEATDFDLYGAPIEWCTDVDHKLAIREDGSFQDVQVLQPATGPECEDADVPNGRTVTIVGQWTALEISEDGEILLSRTWTSETTVYDGPKDDEVVENPVEELLGVATGTRDEQDWLQLYPLGLFQREGE